MTHERTTESLSLTVPVDNPTTFSSRPWWLDWSGSNPSIVVVSNPRGETRGIAPVEDVIEMGSVPIAEFEKPLGMSDLALDSLKFMVQVDRARTMAEQVVS